MLQFYLGQDALYQSDFDRLVNSIGDNIGKDSRGK
jgi:hypothetical protein